jgi:hypothetical protein
MALTPKQIERIRTKIARIRKELAADKKHWGGFHHDSRGLRYMPPKLFIKIKDYKGALRYLRWFKRTFTDDSAYPLFFLEWALILFKTGKLKEAEKKAFELFFADYSFLDRFLETKIGDIERKNPSDIESKDPMVYVEYIKDDPDNADFIQWLRNLCNSPHFKKFANELIDIENQLELEPPGKKRSAMIEREYALLEEMSGNA